MVKWSAVGAGLVVAGVVLFAVTFAGSAALAPSIGTADGDASGKTLVGSQGGGPGLHEGGSVYLLGDDEEEWREESADSYFDVTMLDNGSVAAGFMDGGYEDCGPYESPCTHSGFRIIDPEPEPRVISEFSFPVRTRANSEVHDVERLPTGEFLLTDMDRERIVTVRGGEVTWQWNASDFYEAPDDPTTTDWLHINDVDRIGDGRYLVSVRNANQLVIVQRGQGVVEVINEDRGSDDASCRANGQLVDRDGDGDVRCGDPSVLDHQHNPQWLGSGAVLVADSGNDRVVELHENDETGEWEVAWELAAAEGVEFGWPRDADRLSNGNTLVTDSANQRLVEVNQSGATIWSHRTDLIPYEAERLPEGETVGGPRYGSSGLVSASAGSDVPVLSLALQIARTSVPLPFWLSELHVFVTFVSLSMVGAGGWLLRRR